MPPSNNSNNSQGGSNVPGASGSPTPTDPQSREFQIPREDNSSQSVNSVPQNSPPAFPSTPPQPPVQNNFSAPQMSRNSNLPYQPPRHEKPIYMKDTEPASYPAKPQVPASPPPVPVPPARPISGQPLQKPIPAPAGISTSSPSQRRGPSMVKYAIFALIALIVAALLVWFVSGIFSGDEPNQPEPNQDSKDELSTKSYQSDSMQFTTKYPDDWLQNDSKEGDLETVKFSSPDIRSNGTAIAETAILRISKDSLKGNKNQETFFKTYEKAVTSAFESYTQTDSEIITIDQYPAKRIEANVNVDGESDKAIFYFVYAKDSGYAIVSYADQEVYDEYKPRLDIFVSEFDSQLNN